MSRIDFRVEPKSVYVFPGPLSEEGGRHCSRHTILTFIFNSRRWTKSKKSEMIRNTITTPFFPTKLYLHKHSTLFHIPLCRHDVVSIVTRLREKGPGFDSRQVQELYFLPKIPENSGACPASYQWITRSSFSGLNAAGA